MTREIWMLLGAMLLALLFAAGLPRTVEARVGVEAGGWQLAEYGDGGYGVWTAQRVARTPQVMPDSPVRAQAWLTGALR